MFEIKVIVLYVLLDIIKILYLVILLSLYIGLYLVVICLNKFFRDFRVVFSF